jgi:hypothetical protein
MNSNKPNEEKNNLAQKDDAGALVVPKKKVLLLLFLCGLLIVLCIVLIAIILNNPFEETFDTPILSGWEELRYLEKPILNFTVGQFVAFEGLRVQWDDCPAADFYKYNIILLDGEPDYGNDNEAEKEGSIILAQNINGTTETCVLIPKSSLKPEKWVKIAVSSCQTDYELWQCIYIYIKTDEWKG